MLLLCCNMVQQPAAACSAWHIGTASGPRMSQAITPKVSQIGVWTPQASQVRVPDIEVLQDLRLGWQTSRAQADTENTHTPLESPWEVHRRVYTL